MLASEACGQVFEIDTMRRTPPRLGKPWRVSFASGVNLERLTAWGLAAMLSIVFCLVLPFLLSTTYEYVRSCAASNKYSRKLGGTAGLWGSMAGLR